MWYVVPGADKMSLAPVQQKYRGCRLSLLFLLLLLLPLPWSLPEAPHKEVARLSSPTCIFVRRGFLPSSLVCVSSSEDGKRVGESLVWVWLFPEVSTKPGFALQPSICPRACCLPAFANSAHRNRLSWALRVCWAGYMSHP